MALTEDQKTRRRSFIGGSDANTILSGNSEKILRLWREKTGLIEPEDLDDNLPVQMGIFTEPFNIKWFEAQTGKKVTANGEQRVSAVHPFMGCTLDGLTDNGETVFEAKHVSAFSKEEEIVNRYLPQLTHNMIVCGVRKAVLSVFFGNHKWEKFDIALDDMYAVTLINAIEKFWKAVQTKETPVVIVVKPPVDPTRKIDMSTNNVWGFFAAQYKENLENKKLCEDAANELKKLIEDDVSEAFGNGIHLKRDKRGALRFKGEA